MQADVNAKGANPDSRESWLNSGQPDRAEVRIMIGTPCGQGGVSPTYLQTVMGVQRLCTDLGWDVEVHVRPDALVSRTRNIFASRIARDDTYTHLLMVDADIGFDPLVVQRLVTSGHPVVGACVPLREVRWEKVNAAANSGLTLTPTELASVAHGHAVSFAQHHSGTAAPQNGFLPARFLGAALLLIRRDALVTLAGSQHVTHYRQGGQWRDWEPDGWTFFDPCVEPGTGLYLSEDYAFCHRWRAIGGTVWADVDSRVTHTGNVTVQGDVASSVRTHTRLARARKTGPE